MVALWVMPDGGVSLDTYLSMCRAQVRHGASQLLDVSIGDRSTCDPQVSIKFRPRITEAWEHRGIVCRYGSGYIL